MFTEWLSININVLFFKEEPISDTAFEMFEVSLLFSVYVGIPVFFIFAILKEAIILFYIPLNSYKNNICHRNASRKK